MKKLFTMFLCSVLYACSGMQTQSDTDQKTFKMGLQAYHATQWQAAQNLLQQVLVDEPKHIEANFLLGNIAVRNKSFAKTVTHFQTVIRLQPHHTKAQDNIALVHLILAERYFKQFSAHQSSPLKSKKLVALLMAIDTFADNHLSKQS